MNPFRHVPTYLLLVFVCVIQISWIEGSLRYYWGYLSYGTGDTIVHPYHYHGGPNDAHHKWLVECNDGEAVWAIHCVVRDYTSQFFCFDRTNASNTINSFITGLWDNEHDFANFRYGTSNDPFIGDSILPYKCCKTPKGYYIDYVSCYYASNHDQYHEFYDSLFWFITTCGTGYVATGMARKLSPYFTEYNMVWIQCCRLGFGAPIAVSPPIIRQPDGRTTFYAKTAIEPPYLPPGYAKQYARSMDGLPEFSLDSSRNFSEIIGGKSFEIDHLRYGRGPVPEALTGRGPGYDGVKAFKDPRDAITRMDIRSM